MRYFLCVNKLDISLAKKEIAIQRKVCYKHLKFPWGTIMIYKIQLLTRSLSRRSISALIDFSKTIYITQIETN